MDSKTERLRDMSTDALREIASHPLPPESEEPSRERPLGGLVHITGIGQVSLKAIKAELESRGG